MYNAKFHAFHRMIFLCEVPGDWSRLVRLEFLNTAVVFIHSVSNRPFGLSYVLESTLVAIYYVNYIGEFACELVFWWE